MSLGAYHDELYEQVLPLHGPDPDGLAQDLVGAWCHGVIEVDELVRDTDEGPGWGVILDVDMAPAKGLRWLAQLAGVELRPSKTITVYNLANVFGEQDGSFEDDGRIASIWGGTRVDGGTSGNSHLRKTKAGPTGDLYASMLVGSGPYQRTTIGVDVLALARAASIQVEWYDGAFSTIRVDTAPASTVLGRRSATFVSPAGTEQAGYRFIMPSTVAGESFDIDSFAIIVGTDDADYFDGFSQTRAETTDEWAAYARQAIREQGAKFRGTRRAMLDAVRDTLTGSKFVSLLERVGGNAYALTLITRPSETPDSAVTLAAAERQKPLGMKITYAPTEGVLIDEGTRTIDSATATIDTATRTDVAT